MNGETHYSGKKEIGSIAVPAYKTESVVLLGGSDEEKEPEQKPIKNLASCFNCGGDHNLPDCPIPKDYLKINQSRKKFFESRGSVRYHVETKTQYDHFKPGKISSNLRDALGISSKDIPDFIYRMRYLGYPKGWLKEAEAQKFSVKLFDGEGNSSEQCDETAEKVEEVSYEIDKLVSFPGFNVPYAKKQRDDYRRYGYPPMNPIHSKDRFESYMKNFQARKQRKTQIRNTRDAQVENASLQSVSMEIEALDPEPLIEIPLPIKDTSSYQPPDKEEGECEDSNSPVPPKEPHIPVHDMTDKLTTESISSSGSPVTITASPAASISSPAVDSPVSLTGSPAVSTDSSVPIMETPVTVRKLNRRSLSKGSVAGVCLPVKERRFSPSAAKWAVNISDPLVFENLPHSTGKWNKMRKLISRVRDDITET